jgi:hypothetical protein
MDEEELKLRRSFYNNIALVLDLITLKILLSSAKAATFEFTMEEDRSLVYKRKNSGPRMEPCGTPDVTSSAVDVAPRSEKSSLLSTIFQVRIKPH